MPEIDEWYYSDAQQQQAGPVPFAKIKQLVADEQIHANTLLWNEDMIKWTPAEKVPGLFLSAPPLASAPPLVSGSPQQAQNPYAPPISNAPNTNPTGDTYQCPPVKRCSFGLFMGLTLVGLVFCVFGFWSLVSTLKDGIDNLPPYENIQTEEDLENYERTINEYAQNTIIDSPPTSAIAMLLLGSVAFLISGILGFIYLYRAWFILQPGGARTTPGAAVGFLFIPLFNFYWWFVAYGGWSPDWNNIRNRYSNLRHIAPSNNGLFLAMPITLICTSIPVLGTFSALASVILYIIVIHKMCKIVNAVADTQGYRR